MTARSSAPRPPQAFSERLWPGPVGWVVAVALAGMLAVAFWPVAPVVGAVAGGAGLAGALVVVVTTASRVEVSDGWLRAGPARIPLTVLRDPQPLDVEQTRTELGPGLDARAYLCQRGWVRTAVRVRVDDPDDPTPYWLVSTRRPAELVRALNSTDVPSAQG